MSIVKPQDEFHSNKNSTSRKCLNEIRLDEKSYECKSCGKIFSAERELYTHILTHTEEKLHECKICKKTFSLKANLKAHFLTHTKMYECDVCNRKFKQENSLKSHMKAHRGTCKFLLIVNSFDSLFMRF